MLGLLGGGGGGDIHVNATVYVETKISRNFEKQKFCEILWKNAYKHFAMTREIYWKLEEIQRNFAFR